MSAETSAQLLARLDAAVAARARQRGRPLRDTIAALAAATERWRDDASLRAELPRAARLSPAMIAAVVPIAADALDATAMTALAEREWGAGAAARPAPPGPALVAHVVASNVPALALPAIALGCLAGAAVLVKSGRDDPLSAPAFQRALAAVDPALAATVVTAYWPGGEVAREDAALGRAEVVVATGGDATLAALAPRLGRRLVAHGPRWSVALVGSVGAGDVDAIALDTALHDQRGCLSPHAVYVTDDARGFAERLAAALDGVGAQLPPGPASVDARAATRLVAAEAEWAPGAAVLGGAGGTVIYEDAPAFRPTAGRRTVRVHPLCDARELVELLPTGEIECVGVAGIDPAPLVAALRARGVARVCPVGRMQRPPLSWPRGQHAPLGALLGRRAEPLLEVEP